MNAAKKSQQSWESLNEERFILAIEGIISFNKLALNRFLLILNLLAFVSYKLLFVAGLFIRALFIANPIVRIEREESWVYRQIK